MIRIINNTDQDYRRLLVLFEKELNLIKEKNIELIVFDSCAMTVWGIDEILLEVRD